MYIKYKKLNRKQKFTPTILNLKKSYSPIYYFISFVIRKTDRFCLTRLRKKEALKKKFPETVSATLWLLWSLTFLILSCPITFTQSCMLWQAASCDWPGLNMECNLCLSQVTRAKEESVYSWWKAAFFFSFYSKPGEITFLSLLSVVLSSSPPRVFARPRRGSTTLITMPNQVFTKTAEHSIQIWNHGYDMAHHSGSCHNVHRIAQIWLDEQHEVRKSRCKE